MVTDVHVFLKMERFGETIKLQKAVNDLVKRDFEEISNFMEQFLKEKEEATFTHNRPVLYEFLRHVSFNTKDYLANKQIRKVLLKFEKKVKHGKQNNIKLDNTMTCHIL